jgi:3-oxoacyl-[acyl-carrier-protein] synthase-3
MKTEAQICGLGFFVPDKVLTNDDLEKLVETSDEWITTRTGIKKRHIVEGEACSDLALVAARNALRDAALTPRDLTHIVLATFTPDCYIPNAASVLQKKLGIKDIPCCDVNAACTGFIYALDLARGLCALHSKAKILVVASEVVTSRVNFNDRSTCVLFGDGAGAAILSSTTADGAVIEDIILKADGSLGELLTVKGGGSAYPLKFGQQTDENFFVQMQGRAVFKHAVRSMTNIAYEILEKNNLSVEDVDLLIPHQANNRIIEAVAKKLGISPEKVFVNVQNYGNTSAASVPIALAEAREKGRISPGDRVLLVAFGGGFTWGAALLKF